MIAYTCRAFTFTICCKGLHEFKNPKWFRLYATIQHYCTSNRGFAVTPKQQTSFIITNGTTVKLLYLKRKHDISITDFFHLNEWNQCKAYSFATQKNQTQSVYLSTRNIKPWLQIWLKFCKRLYEFHKSNNTYMYKAIIFATHFKCFN